MKRPKKTSMMKLGKRLGEVLTPLQLKICALSLIERFSDYEVARKLKTTPAAVNAARYRARRACPALAQRFPAKRKVTRGVDSTPELSGHAAGQSGDLDGFDDI